MRDQGGYDILPFSWFVNEAGGKNATRKDDTSDLSRQSRESRLRLKGAPNGLV